MLSMAPPFAPGALNTKDQSGIQCAGGGEHAPSQGFAERNGPYEWVALTHNLRIRYTPNELAAVIRHQVRLLVIVGKAHLPAVGSFLCRDPRPNPSIPRRHGRASDSQGVPGHTRGAREEPGGPGPDRALVSKVAVNLGATIGSPRG